MASVESDDEDHGLDLFQEPDGYYAPEKEPTQVQHTTKNGTVLTIHMIGHSPLWVRAIHR